MSTTITHRITALERWGYREAADFQPAAVAQLKEAGFTGILINGGSGIGPDQIPAEAMVVTRTLPDLMPETAAGEQIEAHRRYNLTCAAGLQPWLMMWGVPGPDIDSEGGCAASNSFFDRRSKLEMKAKLRRTPELFGARRPADLSWRGNRPLCISHPTVQAFYDELAEQLLSDYPELTGLFFFPGDNSPESCDESCARCREQGNAGWSGLIGHVNRLYRRLSARKPGFALYFTVWNQVDADGDARIRSFLDQLDPGIGIAMSISDGRVVEAGGVRMRYNQPWVNMPEYGEQFLMTAELARAAGRPLMVVGEIAQAELWDPVCHNLPEPAHVLRLLSNTQALDGADALFDFWGHRGPFRSHANLRAMQAWSADPEADHPILLRRAASAHYEVADDAPEMATALDAWEQLRESIESWPLQGWQQRFSFAIGRPGARGALYKPLIPPVLKQLPPDGWCWRTLFGEFPEPMDFYQRQLRDQARFERVAKRFSELSETLRQAGRSVGAELAAHEAATIRLAGSLHVSIARTTLAVSQYRSGDADGLRRTIREEIGAREEQLRIGGELGHGGGGVDPVYVSEDLQIMRFYLSCHDFPETPDALFQLTPSPYSV